jgi:ribosomal protein S18 acetylase RimI-like enzyme
MIRAAKPADTPAMGDIFVDAFSDKFSVIFRNKLSQGKALMRHYWHLTALDGAFVAEVNSEVAGIIQLQTTNTPQYSSVWGLLRGLDFFGVLRTFLAFIILEHKIQKNECYVEHLAVSEAFRGRGLGKALLRQGEEFAREHQKSVYSLFVAIDNQGAHQLYRSVGFVDVKVKNSLLTKWFLGKRSFVFMQKQLP